MRILFLLPDFPFPPSTGGRLKVFNILKHLSIRHCCEILCFGSPSESDLAGLCTQLPRVRVLAVVPRTAGSLKLMSTLQHLVRGLPPSVAAYSSRKYSEHLRMAVAGASYDLIHYDIVNMAQYLELGCATASVHSPNDATSLAYFRMSRSSERLLERVRLLASAVLLRRYERRIYRRFDKVHVVSGRDADYLAGIGSGADIATIPIAVADELLSDIAYQKHQESVARDNRPIIVCTGNLGIPAIASGVRKFAQAALPLIVEQIGDVRFVILGQNATKELREQLVRTPNTEFLSWVDDYPEFLSRAHVVLVPDRVGPPGAKTRTLEAMALGVPVVGTATAFAGIPFTDGKQGFLYETMPECAKLILALLNDPATRERIGALARELVINQFSLSVVGPMYERLYANAINKFQLRHQLGADKAKA